MIKDFRYVVIGLAIGIASANATPNTSNTSDFLANISQKEEATTFQINPAHTGSISFAAGFSAPLVKLWTFDAGTAVSYPLIVGGKVYVVGGGNDLFALDAATGTQIWEHLLGGVENYGAYDAGMLFYENGDGQLAALKARSGKQIWAAAVSDDFSSSPPIALNGQVFVSGGAVTALDEATGVVQWTQPAGGSGGAASFGDEGIYVGGSCDYYKYAPADGALLWHVDNGCSGGGGMRPAYFQHKVYLADWTQGNPVLDSRSGALAGTFSGDLAPAFFKGNKKRGYALEYSDGKLYCVDVKTGNVLWNFSESAIVGQPIVINGQPIVGTSTGKIYMLDGTTGTQLWSDTLGSYVNSMNAGGGVLAISAGTKVTVYRSN